MKSSSSLNNNLKILIDTIDKEIGKRSLLNHQFYTLWREGKLTFNHLRGYSKEYFQLVKAVPEFVQNIYNSFENNFPREYYLNYIRKTQIDESEHIEPWVKFALSLGIEKTELNEYKGSNDVNIAIENLKKLSKSSIAESVSAMYSFEKELPQISKTKIEGLEKYYGISNNDALQYFKIHEIADIEHAKLWQTIIFDNDIDKINKKSSAKSIVNASIKSLTAQNEILDSVYNTYVKDTFIK